MCFYGATTSGKTTTVSTILQAIYNLPQSTVVYNHSWTPAAISQATYLMGSLTALHDDILRKNYTYGVTLSQFIMSIASKMPFK